MIVARKKEKLKLGEGAAFDPARLKELPQENETWEADFEALPKPPTQNERHFLGMVVSKKGRCILAEMQVSRPSINDMATMLANAMLSPLSGDAHRPSRIYARYYTPWDDVYPHLKEIGIKVSAHREFPWIYLFFHERLRQMREMRSPGKVEPTAEQAKAGRDVPLTFQVRPRLRFHRNRRSRWVRLRRQGRGLRLRESVRGRQSQHLG